MRIRNFLVVAVLAMSAFASASIGPGHVTGSITNITSITGGLLVRIGPNEVPQNCTSGKVWMFIPQDQTAMVSLTLMAWTMGKTVAVYTAPTNTGYCLITQVDPAG
ncbi:hypothetical protein [Reinekea sp. G2M2-21]|uniref:hypothetical protein n=1 Tax=Reinekea sp. G2M2-21 TaxID=2788942 RepID=UPI0018A97EB3|nr:hypothetical protein [Reinekea sp. G2M2-21]